MGTIIFLVVKLHLFNPFKKQTNKKMTLTFALVQGF